MQIFSIVVTYNGIKWYDRCFGSLQNSSMPVSVVVVDNGSTDGTVDYIRCRYPEIVVLQQDENLGFAKANNVGMRYAMDHGADYVFLLNQDAWINERNTISELIRISQENPRYYILSPLQLYAGSGRIQSEVLYHFACEARCESDYLSDLYYHRVHNLYEISFMCAACWLLPISVVQKIGGFDPIFYHYGEDDNYIHRVHYHGGKVAICPTVSYSHDIETRSNDYRVGNQDWRKFLLIQLCDINSPLNMDVLLRNKRVSLLFMFLRIQRKKFRKLYPEYEYLQSIRNGINASRRYNRIGGTCWL